MLTLKKIFLAFFKDRHLCVRGRLFHDPFFERELVDKHKWITHDEFVDSLAIGQMTPGPPIVNTGICIGYKLHRLKGALAATFGQSFTGTVLAISTRGLLSPHERQPAASVGHERRGRGGGGLACLHCL